MEFQLTGVQQLLQRHSLLLADDMGLGKTVQSIAALRILVIQLCVVSALVVLEPAQPIYVPTCVL
jgi:SNF2 family DNA or RNA helicase